MFRWLTNLLKTDLLGTTAVEIDTALRQAQMNTLPFICASVGVFAWFYAAFQWFILQEAGAAVLAAVALVSGVIFFLLFYGSQQGWVPLAWVYRVLAFTAVICLANMLLRFYITHDPKQTANLILLMMGIGVIVLSSRWFVVLIGLCLVGWGVGVWLNPTSADWPYYSIIMLTTAASTLVIHIARVRNYRHSEVMRLVERRQREELHRLALQLETTSEVGQRITSIFDLDILLHQIAELIRTRNPNCFVGIYLPNATGIYMTARPSSANSLNPDGFHLRVSNEGLVGWVMANGRALHLDDVTQHPHYRPAELIPHTRSVLILPLRMGTHVQGVLDLQSQQTAAFSAEDEQLFQLIADQIAIAVRNGQLYEQTRHFNERLEKMVAERTAELEEAYRRLSRLDQTKADFISIASHELRTPLTIISFNNQMLLQEALGRHQPENIRWAEGIRDGVLRISSVIESMLDVAQIDTQSLALHWGTVPLYALMGKLQEQFHAVLAQRRLTLQVADLRPLPPVWGDVKALEKIFYHILVNAIKYTPDGGQIRVSGRAFTLNMEDHPATPAIQMRIEDTGIGIPTDALDLIFEKFYQTGPVLLHSSGQTSFKGGGSGLGLAIAKGLVQAHRGLIWAESDGYDEVRFPGSTITVVLPVGTAENKA